MKFNANGTRPFHRNDYYLVNEGILNYQEFALFEFLINQMGFDQDKPDSYGIVRIESYSELALFFGYDSDNSVRDKVKKLIGLGLLMPSGLRRFRITNHKRYLAKTAKWAGESEDYRMREMNATPSEVLQSIGVKVQSTEGKLQLVEKSSPILLKSSASRYLSSSKVKSNLSVSVPITRPLAEYEEIKTSGEFPGLTIDDMQWIDAHTYTEKYQ